MTDPVLKCNALKPDSIIGMATDDGIQALGKEWKQDHRLFESPCLEYCE